MSITRQIDRRRRYRFVERCREALRRMRHDRHICENLVDNLGGYNLVAFIANTANLYAGDFMRDGFPDLAEKLRREYGRWLPVIERQIAREASASSPVTEASP